MFYSFYQKKTLAYFVQKIKGGKIKPQQNDIQRLNLKANIKSYQLISKKENGGVIEKIMFNKNGDFIRHSIKNELRIYAYDGNSKLSKCEIFENENKLMATEYFEYGSEGKLISKKMVYELNRKKGWQEHYEYDLRKNVTAAIKLYDLDDVIQTKKYDKYGSLTDSFYFTNNRYDGRNCEKSEKIYGGKFKTITQYSDENDIITQRSYIVNDKEDIIAELFYNSLNYMLSDDATSTLQFIYKYDEFENWTNKIKYYNGSFQEELITEIEYF